MIKRYILIFLLVIASVYLFSAVLLPVSAKYTPLCGLCHATRSEFVSWKTSSHAENGCLDCHGEPGVGGKMMLLLKSGRNFIGTFSGGASVQARVSNDVCLNCHNNLLYDTVTKNGIHVSHREIIAAGWRCPECHASVGHRLSVATFLSGTPSMDKCFTCHKQGGADTGCNTCHKDKVGGLPKNPKTVGLLAHTAGWSKRHGFDDQKTCRSCHQKSFCAGCHQIDLPHNSNWPDEHGKAALSNQSACKTCHKKSFCVDCHQIEMPHPNPYNHSQEKNKLKITICWRCHNAPECDNCHKLHIAHKVNLSGGK